MEPSNRTQAPKSSFNIPKEMIENQRLNAASAKPPEQQSAGQATLPKDVADKFVQDQINAAEEEKKIKTAESERAENTMKMKAEIEERYKVSLDDNDIKVYLIKGRLQKEMEIIPGLFKATFQTHTPEEISTVDVHIAEFMDKGKYTSEGLANERAIKTLSLVWIMAEGKQLGRDAAHREKTIRSMSAHLVDYAAQAWQDLNLLIKIALEEKSILKKLQAPLK